MNYPITDGFVLSTKQRCSLTFRDIVVQEYELLRRASAFRNKTWLAPKDSTITIPASDSYEYQIPIKPGSVIWGYCFVANTALQPNQTLSFQVRDACDDIPLFSEEITRLAVEGIPNDPTQYLSKLLIVGPPGLLNVVICNTYPEAMNAQVVLFGGEPV